MEPKTKKAPKRTKEPGQREAREEKKEEISCTGRRRKRPGEDCRFEAKAAGVEEVRK